MIRSLNWSLRVLAMLLMHSAVAAERDPSRTSDDRVAQAIRLEHGEGVAKDPARAAELYCRAAQAGSADAAYRLGWIYANGRGLPRDDDYAVALFRQAADQGDDHAKRMLQRVHSDQPRLPDCIAAQGDRVAAAAPSETPPFVETAAGPVAERDPRQEIAAMLAAWADAWSRRDVAAYLAAYSSEFAAPGARSRSQWEQERRARIARRKSIEVRIDALAIRVDGDWAHARFRQDYRSDQRSETGNKELTLVKVDGRWMIQRECNCE